MKTGLAVLFLICGFALAAVAAEPVPTGSFEFQFTVELPGTPEAVFDAATGDISGWWDHSMSENPVRLLIEPKPGGHFLEVMNEAGDGVIHATVTQVEKGKMLRMVGPMGLAGNAIYMVTTWTLAPREGNHTAFTVEVHAAGEVHEGWGDMVEKTWRHFIEGQLNNYLK